MPLRIALSAHEIERKVVGLRSPVGPRRRAVMRVALLGVEGSVVNAAGRPVHLVVQRVIVGANRPAAIVIHAVALVVRTVENGAEARCAGPSVQKNVLEQPGNLELPHLARGAAMQVAGVGARDAARRAVEMRAALVQRLVGLVGLLVPPVEQGGPARPSDVRCPRRGSRSPHAGRVLQQDPPAITRVRVPECVRRNARNVSLRSSLRSAGARSLSSRLFSRRSCSSGCLLFICLGTVVAKLLRSRSIRLSVGLQSPVAPRL